MMYRISLPSGTAASTAAPLLPPGALGVELWMGGLLLDGILLPEPTLLRIELELRAISMPPLIRFLLAERMSEAERMETDDLPPTSF